METRRRRWAWLCLLVPLVGCSGGGDPVGDDDDSAGAVRDSVIEGNHGFGIVAYGADCVVDLQEVEVLDTAEVEIAPPGHDLVAYGLDAYDGAPVRDLCPAYDRLVYPLDFYLYLNEVDAYLE